MHNAFIKLFSTMYDNDSRNPWHVLWFNQSLVSDNLKLPINSISLCTSLGISKFSDIPYVRKITCFCPLVFFFVILSNHMCQLINMCVLLCCFIFFQIHFLNFTDLQTYSTQPFLRVSILRERPTIQMLLSIHICNIW